MASFGDFFADTRAMKLADAKSKAADAKAISEIKVPITNGDAAVSISTTEKAPDPVIVKRRAGKDQDIKCLVYKDPFGSTYKKYIFTADGKYLLGGMMIGDVGDYVKLVSIVKKKVRLIFSCIESKLD